MNTKFSSFNDVLTEINTYVNKGYEVCVIGKNDEYVKYGSTIKSEDRLPDEPQNCRIKIWQTADQIETYLFSQGLE